MARRSLAAMLLGAVVGLALVGSATGFQLAHTTPVVVRFGGVALDITYLNGSAHVFGATDQNACNESLAIGPSTPALRPDCPGALVGGVSYDLQFFVAGNAGSAPGLWTNWTVTAPFDFELNPNMYGWVPTTFSAVTGLYEGGGHFLYTAGEFSGWALVFTMPTTLHSPPSGLWLNATLMVEPTNQTQV